MKKVLKRQIGNLRQTSGRLAVFAAYNKDGKISDDVLYYLKELKKVVDGIVYISDNEVLEEETEKLNGLVLYYAFEQHGEYDFGSYKRGYFWLKENGYLDDAEELIFCNDSVFGPFRPFPEFFDRKKEDGNPDFYGLCKSKWGFTKYRSSKGDIKFVMSDIPHLSSFFLVFNKQIFTWNKFADFLMSVKHQPEKGDIIILYEQGLSRLIFDAGFSYGYFLKEEKYDPVQYMKKGYFLKKMPYVNISYYSVNMYIKNHTTYPFYIDESIYYKKDDVDLMFWVRLFIKFLKLKCIYFKENNFILSLRKEATHSILTVLGFKIKTRRHSPTYIPYEKLKELEVVD